MWLSFKANSSVYGVFFVVCLGRYLWLGSMVVRGFSGCEAAEPVAWLEKRRCDITLGRKASCSLTTLGILMESSTVKGE